MDKVRLLDDPILRKPCEPVPADLSVQELNDILSRMGVTMAREQGIGLAANQIGISLRIFILKRGDSFDTFDTYINPEIINAEEEVTFDTEGCLSIPGVVSPTKRFRKVTVRYRDVQGTTQEKSVENIDAFAVQHEMDHLNGKLYIDQYGPVKKQMVVAKHKKFLRRMR